MGSEAPAGIATVSPLVSAEWAAKHLDDASVRFIDVEYDRSAYERGHLPGAIRWTWQDDLVDPVRRELVDPSTLSVLLARSGIGPETHVVLYGDDDWYAAWALWQLRMHGVTRVSLLDGGRGFWRSLGLPYGSGAADVAPVEAVTWDPDHDLRIGYRELRAGLGSSLAVLDVRLDEEYRGELTAPAGYPALAQRAGHIPGATRAPWESALDGNGRFLPREELRDRFARLGVDSRGQIVTYCGVGVRSAHSWFVLHELLGYAGARNYDGGWAEWGSVIGAPIEVGDAAGKAA